MISTLVDIEGMSRDFIIVKRGYINEHYYYIPMTKVEGWDGEVLWLRVKEDDVKSKYERQIKPDPSRYYLKDISDYSVTFPELKSIPPKYKRPIRKAASIPPDGHKKRKYGCALCERLFKSHDQLSKHVASVH